MEIRDGEVLIETNGALVAFNLFARVLVLSCLDAEALQRPNDGWPEEGATTYSFLMLAESGMDDTDVEEDFAGIVDFGKLL